MSPAMKFDGKENKRLVHNSLHPASVRVDTAIPVDHALLRQHLLECERQNLVIPNSGHILAWSTGMAVSTRTEAG